MPTGAREIERPVGDAEMPAEMPGRPAGAVRRQRIEREAAPIAAALGDKAGAVGVAEVVFVKADRPRPAFTLFPYTTLFRSGHRPGLRRAGDHRRVVRAADRDHHILAR